MIDELEAMFGRKVDIIPEHVVGSPMMNKHVSASISSSTRILYDETP
jgi:hypothetical protein